MKRLKTLSYENLDRKCRWLAGQYKVKIMQNPNS